MSEKGDEHMAVPTRRAAPELAGVSPKVVVEGPEGRSDAFAPLADEG